MKKLPYPFGFRGFSFNEMEIVMSDLKIEELTKEQEEFLASEKCNCRFHVDEYVYLPKFCLFLACFKYSSFYYACDTDTLLELPNNSEPSFILGNRYLQFSGGEADAIATARLTASQCGFLPGSKIDFAFPRDVLSLYASILAICISREFLSASRVTSSIEICFTEDISSANRLCRRRENIKTKIILFLIIQDTF